MWVIMSNMAYGRMENTYNDLCECFENWEDTSSESELAYRARILKLAQKIVDEYGDHNAEDS